MNIDTVLNPLEFSPEQLELRAKLAASLAELSRPHVDEFCPSNLYEFVSQLDGFTDKVISRVDGILTTEAIARHFEE